MSEAREPSKWLVLLRQWHDTTASLVLVLMGVLLLVGAATLDRAQAVQIAFLVIGSGVLIVGAFLTRIEGTIKIGPTGFQLGVAPVAPILDSIEKLELTRERAEEVAPSSDDVDEAIGRAYRELFPAPTALPAAVAVSLAGSPSGFIGANWSMRGWQAQPPGPAPTLGIPAPSPDVYRTAFPTLGETPSDFVDRVIADLTEKWSKTANAED